MKTLQNGAEAKAAGGGLDGCFVSSAQPRGLGHPLVLLIGRSFLRQHGFPTALPLLLLLFLSGLPACTTKSKARREATAAYNAGHTDASKQAQTQQQPSVTVLGLVRNHTVPWREGMTLAEAIDAAVYTGFSDPLLVRLTRGPDTVEIKIRDLLRGASNPTLEAGDVVELRR